MVKKVQLQYAKRGKKVAAQKIERNLLKKVVPRFMEVKREIDLD